MKIQSERTARRWTMRPQAKAVAFLAGLGLIVSAGLVGSVAALARIGSHVIGGAH